MNKKYSFTKEQIEQAAETSESKTEMMRTLKIRQGGGGYQTLLHWCRKFGVVPPDGLKISKKNLKPRQTNFRSIPDSEWFIEGSRRSGPASRKRIVKLGVPDQCSVCGMDPEWCGKSLTLQVDHINGDRWDNRLVNLRILCPNCHSQTDTYANTGLRRVRNYCGCGEEIWKNSNSCNRCASIVSGRARRVIDWPEVDEIVSNLESTSYLKYAKVLGVSDNAVRKNLRSHGIDPKTLKPLVV